MENIREEGGKKYRYENYKIKEEIDMGRIYERNDSMLTSTGHFYQYNNLIICNETRN